MIQCKIGLIAKSCNSTQDCFLILGEIFDNNIKNNITKLYELHYITKYLYPFNIKQKNNIIIPDNFQEILYIQKTYKLTRILSIIGTGYNKKFETPQLYDLSCMIPLFKDKIPRNIIKNKQNYQTGLRVIILLPYLNPILRGKIIESSLSITKQMKTIFYTIGDVKGKNLVPISELSKRYLLSCGINEENIYVSNYDKKDCIIEAISMLEFFFQNINFQEIILAVSQKDMNKFLSLIRSYRLSGILKYKLQLLCNNF